MRNEIIACVGIKQLLLFLRATTLLRGLILGRRRGARVLLGTATPTLDHIKLFIRNGETELCGLLLGLAATDTKLLHNVSVLDKLSGSYPLATHASTNVTCIRGTTTVRLCLSVASLTVIKCVAANLARRLRVQALGMKAVVHPDTVARAKKSIAERERNRRLQRLLFWS